MEYKYKFSVITAVYNVEPFIRECIDSIINQTIGFENIQLILVDDGTPDNSGAICDEYAEKYPKNIVVIHKENGGVSSARNSGIAAAEGKYINFVDSDDMLSVNVLAEVYDFFEANCDSIDMISIPITFFDAKTGNHPLNCKFGNESRVLNLKDEWNMPQMHIASSFLKKEALKDLKFDVNLAYAEDAKLAQQILLKKQNLGLVVGCAYLYRIRSAGEASAMQNSGKKPNWYLPVIKNFHLYMIDYALKNLNTVPKFLQMTLMYDMQWRVKMSEELMQDVITDNEKEEYLFLLKKALSYIDDDVIMAQKNMFREHKLRAFMLKYNKEPDILNTSGDVILSFQNGVDFKLSKCKAHIEFIKINGKVLKIEGYIPYYNFKYENVLPIALINGKKTELEITERSALKDSTGKVLLKRCGFVLNFVLEGEKKANIKLGININGIDIYFKKITYGYFSPVNTKYIHSYYYKNNYAILPGFKEITVVSFSKKNHIARESKFILDLLKNKKTVKDAFLRLLYVFFVGLKKRPVWLISDRPKIAGDNGEAFFEYMAQNHPEIDARYVISSDCNDYRRMKKVGKVLKRGSLKHRLFALASRYMLSSQGENEHFNPFEANHNSFRDIIINKPFVFLQHGVTKNDLSGWLNRYNKDIFGIVTVAKREADSFLNYDYFYSEENVWLTGFPRFDKLYDSGEKIISIMPTWRKYLTSGWNKKKSVWEIKADFSESEYFKFYNGLISNDKILTAAEKNGYKIKFILHPNLREAAEFFVSNKVVDIVKEDFSYTDIYAESRLILTDYSSAVFDFAYLRKPIIYTYFDIDDFYSGQHTSTQGYFSDENDGFGEVEYDFEGTVNKIIEYMENDCALKEKYRKRIDDFFAFKDKNNSERLFKKLIERQE